MPTFEFTVALDRAPADDDFDRLFDATPETRDGRGVLNVARDAASMSAAIVSVVRDVTRAGFRVVSVEDDDLVSLKTVAQRTGRSYESVRLLATGKRGPGEFPEPLSGDGWALYSWALVAEWYSRNYGADAVPAVSPDQRVLAAAALMLRAAATAGPATAELVELVTANAPAAPVPVPHTFHGDDAHYVVREASKVAADDRGPFVAPEGWQIVDEPLRSVVVPGFVPQPDDLVFRVDGVEVSATKGGGELTVRAPRSGTYSEVGPRSGTHSEVGPRSGTYSEVGPRGGSKKIRDGSASGRNVKGRA
jgi:hypothetical protein